MKKLKNYADVLYSTQDFIVFAVVYDTVTKKKVLSDSTIEYTIKKYGEKEVKRLVPQDNKFIIYI